MIDDRVVFIGSPIYIVHEMTIDLIIPTRNRPERLKETIRSIEKTANSKGNYRIYLYIDLDDNSYGRYSKAHLIMRGKNKILSECWNDLYRLGMGDILFHGSDDIIFETKDWDLMVIDHFKKHPESLFYGRDGHQDENCPTHSFTSRSAADKIGYFVPPYFEADFNDVWLKEVYEKAGRLFYNPDLMIRHNHVNVNPKFNDATYEIAKERRMRSAKLWEEKNHLIDEDVKKLLG